MKSAVQEKKKLTPQEQSDQMFSHWQHYHVQGNDGVLIATVAVGKKKRTSIWCRGIAICSTSQNFDRSEGAKRATGRLIAAAVNGKTTLEINTSEDRKKNGTKVGTSCDSVDNFIWNSLSEAAGEMTAKSQYKVDLTRREKEILGVVPVC